MRHETFAATGGVTVPRARYAHSRLEVRGPLRRIEGGFIACPGGTETFGPGIEHPFPALLERLTGRVCLNLGTPNAGVGTLLGDEALLDICSRAERVVLQVTGAQGLANRFYSVHPRRNDRFLHASPKLRRLYPEIDFTDFCFVRHMLEALLAQDAARFELLREELRAAWDRRMRGLLARLDAPVTLVALPARLGRGRLGCDPLFVDPAMIEGLRPLVADIVTVPEDGSAPARHRAAARALARTEEGAEAPGAP